MKSAPLVTLGVPVYRGADALPGLLRCLTRQTYRNLEILISIDGADGPSAAAAEPFLSDTRIRLFIQPQRLGWAANTDWTIRNRTGDFWIYMQHDDLISPTYVEDLVEAAAKFRNAAVCFARMSVSGTETGMVQPYELIGGPLERALAHVDRLESGAFRGLFRGTALNRTHGLKVDEFESFGAFHFLMTELALAGEFRFVARPTYHKVMHGQNLHLKWYDWPLERKRGAWASLAAGLFETCVPTACAQGLGWSVAERILRRFIAPQPGQWYFPGAIDEVAPDDMLARILSRLESSSLFSIGDCLQTEWGGFSRRMTARLKPRRPADPQRPEARYT